MMIVIEKLVEMAISLVKERVALGTASKARAARALLDLHSALVDCHESYLDWMQLNGQTLQGHEYERWKRNVERLGSAYRALQEKLAIAAPAVDTSLGIYWVDEIEKVNPRIRDILIQLSDTRVVPTEEIDSMESYPHFDQAIAELRSFIRTQFKWEELFA